MSCSGLHSHPSLGPIFFETLASDQKRYTSSGQGLVLFYDLEESAYRFRSIETTFTPLESPTIYGGDEEGKCLFLYLPRRVTYGLILVFARPLVFRSAAKARNPYTHGVRGEVKAPSFLTGFTSTKNFEMGRMWILLRLFPRRSGHNSNSGSSRTDWESLDSHRFGGIIPSSFLLPIAQS